MANSQMTRQELTAAESKSIGFDYQYYYFLYQMLQLETGQTIGYEVKDDVHIDQPNGEQILVQLKHSIETKANGDVVNLTEKDEDLWKTISNWVKLIKDKAENRTTAQSQIDFINKTTFQLITNKSNSRNNQFIRNIHAFQAGTIFIKDFKEYLKKLSTPKTGKKDSVVDTYISLLEKQSSKWLNAFLQKVHIEHNKDELLNRIKLKIKEKNVHDSRLDDVFTSIDSHLRRMMYHDVKTRKKVLLTFDDYYKNFTRYFELGRARKLPIRLGSSKIVVPQNAESYISVKQLIDTEIISQVDTDYDEVLLRIFTGKFEMNNHLERWLQNSEITEDERIAFEKDTISKWINIYNSVYSSLKRRLRTYRIDEIDENELIELSSECYYETISVKLFLDDTELNTDMSNGQFYLLSDMPVIGWHYNWKERYKK